MKTLQENQQIAKEALELNGLKSCYFTEDGCVFTEDHFSNATLHARRNNLGEPVRFSIESEVVVNSIENTSGVNYNSSTKSQLIELLNSNSEKYPVIEWETLTTKKDIVDYLISKDNA